MPVITINSFYQGAEECCYCKAYKIKPCFSTTEGHYICAKCAGNLETLSVAAYGRVETPGTRRGKHHLTCNGIVRVDLFVKEARNALKV